MSAWILVLESIVASVVGVGAALIGTIGEEGIDLADSESLPSAVN